MKADEGEGNLPYHILKGSPKAKELRKQQTLFETQLWGHLRDRRFFGHKFRRQVPIAQYVVDFCCLEKKIVIELDGSQHVSNFEYDNKRDLELSSIGFKVLRFWNSDMNNNFSEVLNKIKVELE